MGYVALYRQWRPQGFDALVGQEPIRKTLKNSVAAGRISHLTYLPVLGVLGRQVLRKF